MNTLNKLIGIGFLALVACVGWKLGSVLSTDALGMALGVLFGMMAGIPAALIALSANKTVRHEHVHRLEMAGTPAEPRKQPVRLSNPPRRLIVIASPTALPTVEKNRIEVSQ